MPRAALHRPAIFAGALLAAAGVAAWVYTRDRGPAPDGPGDPDPAPGFREAAAAAGVTFHMDYLPGEQGVLPFKINLYDHGSGVAVADFDGDGRDDVYLCNQLGPNALYRNRGDGTFEDAAARAGVAVGDRVCAAACWGDYDNDGRPDLYVATTRGGNLLYRNRGDGTFEDATARAGVGYVGHTQAAAFLDADGDGRLDLLVANTARWTLAKTPGVAYHPGPESLWEMAQSEPEEHRLFRNNGDGTFTDVTRKAGLAGRGWAGDVAVFDYDEDGRPDLFIANMFGGSQLFHNNGDGTFADVTRAVLGKTSWGAVGCRAFDFDNDGRLDLFVTDMHSDMWLPFQTDPHRLPQGAATRKYPHVTGYAYTRAQDAEQTEKKFADTFKIDYATAVFGNTLYRRRPAGGFEEVSDRAGVETFWPWGAVTGDYDNDGFEDVFVPAGMGFPFGYWPNSLLVNNGNGTFTDRAAAAGLDPPPGGPTLDRLIAGRPAARSSRAAAAADFRGVGRLDLVVNNFNDHAYLYRNEFPRRNYVQFRLTGAMRPGDPPTTGPTRKSNRDAIGALVLLRIGNEVMVRQVQAAGGYLSQSSRTLHFGLGDRARVDLAEVVWPSGRRVRLDSPAINTLHELAEDATRPVP